MASKALQAQSQEFLSLAQQAEVQQHGDQAIQLYELAVMALQTQWEQSRNGKEKQDVQTQIDLCKQRIDRLQCTQLPQATQVPMARLVSPNKESTTTHLQTPTEYILSHPHVLPQAMAAQQSALKKVEEHAGGKTNVVAGSAAAGSALGFVAFGPVGAVVGAMGGAYASCQPGAPGDVARASGQLALASYAKVKDLNEKYHLVDKAKKTLGQAKELNEKYQITAKSTQAMKAGLAQAKHLDRKYHVSERAAKGMTDLAQQLEK